MHDPGSLITLLEGYVRFLGDLRKETEDVFSAPIAEGKWSIHNIVCHIMMWDRDFLQRTVLRLEAGDSPPIEEEMDFQAFNDRAVALGRNMSRDQLLDEAGIARKDLIAHLRRLSAELFDGKPRAGKEMSLSEFLQKMFVEHDKHHIDQMRSYLTARSS
jgi:uncharacterized damage-inducible protein DinB